eukprot:gene1119-19292_t
MDGDVTGNDNISGVSDDRDSRETFAGFSASAAGESTTDVNSGLVERPEEHYESDGESSDVDVDDAMSSGSDADDQDNSSLTMPPPDAETSSEKTSLATAPTATELTIPPLLQLLISFVLFYADVGTDVAAVVEAEADVTAPRNLVYLMVVLLVLYPLVLASLDLLYYNGMGWRGAVMDLTGTKMAWATLAALLPFGGHEATAMARVVDSTTLIETIFESQPQLFVQFTALCTGRLSGSTIVVGSIVVSALCTIKTLTWRVNYLFGLDSPDRGWKRTLAIAVYFATDIWTRALAIALVYRTSSGTKTVLLLVSLVVWAIADLVLQTWSKRNDADAQVGGVAAKDYLGNVNATVPVLLRASVVATISGLFNACPMSVQPRDRYRLFTVSSVVTSLMAIAAAIQLRADAVAGSTDASVSSWLQETVPYKVLAQWSALALSPETILQMSAWDSNAWKRFFTDPQNDDAELACMVTNAQVDGMTAGLAAAGSECCTTNLDLSGNQFDDDAGAKIAFALQHVTGVSSVILYDNGLGDKSCAALASTLKMNPSIKSVNLCDNPLSNAAVALLVAINQKTPNRYRK